MQVFILGIFAIALANMVLFKDLWLKDQKEHIKTNTPLTYNALTNSYTFEDLHENAYTYNIARTSKSKLDKEVVQKAMIRTCNAVYQKALWNNCPDAQSVDTTWSFATDIAMQGDLETVWSGSTSNVFVCGSEAEFGRYLLHNALPQSMVAEYGYNLNGVSDYDPAPQGGGLRTYPCGYSEIIYQL